MFCSKITARVSAENSSEKCCSFLHFSLVGINLKRVEFWYNMKYQRIEILKVATTP